MEAFEEKFKSLDSIYKRYPMLEKFTLAEVWALKGAAIESEDYEFAAACKAALIELAKKEDINPATPDSQDR